MAPRAKIRKWTPLVIEEKATKVAEERVALAMTHLEGAVKRKLNRSNSKGRRPSEEGEPPRKGSGDLRRSIFSVVKRVKKQVIGQVGSRLRQARRLELGFVGKDRLGRMVNQGPRPFLRSTYLEQRERIKRIIGGKK